MAGEVFYGRPSFGWRGKAGVAFNAPQTVVYVVRPSQFNPSYDVRWAMFPIEDFSKYASVGQEDQIRTYQAWLKELKASAGFDGA